jgi:hypothetical protein
MPLKNSTDLEPLTIIKPFFICACIIFVSVFGSSPKNGHHQGSGPIWTTLPFDVTQPEQQKLLTSRFRGSEAPTKP